jgi:hypothetical protein
MYRGLNYRKCNNHNDSSSNYLVDTRCSTSPKAIIPSIVEAPAIEESPDLSVEK